MNAYKVNAYITLERFECLDAYYPPLYDSYIHPLFTFYQYMSLYAQNDNIFTKQTENGQISYFMPF